MACVARPCQPSTLRMLIWPEASSAQNSMAAVSADGSTVCVLILRLNSSCSRSIAFVVRTLRHWSGGRRVKVKSRSPASSRLSATARCLSRHLRMKALRRVSISSRVSAVHRHRFQVHSTFLSSINGATWLTQNAVRILRNVRIYDIANERNSVVNG